MAPVEMQQVQARRLQQLVALVVPAVQPVVRLVAQVALVALVELPQVRARRLQQLVARAVPAALVSLVV